MKMILLTEGETMSRLFDLDWQLLADSCLMIIAIFVLFLALSYFLFNPARKFLNDEAVVKSGTVVAQTNVIHTVGEAKLHFRKGDVFITSNTDKGLIPYMMKAAAIVVGNTDGDEFTHAADLGRELKIPVILCQGIDVAATIPDTLLVQIDSNKATVSLADR